MSTQVIEDTKVKLEQPRMFNVVLLNDDFTPQDFVVGMLIRFFQKSEAEAYDLMIQVHRKGKGVAGTYTREVAEQKAMDANLLARQAGHPLMTKAEPQ